MRNNITMYKNLTITKYHKSKPFHLLSNFLARMLAINTALVYERRELKRYIGFPALEALKFHYWSNIEIEKSRTRMLDASPKWDVPATLEGPGGPVRHFHSSQHCHSNGLYRGGFGRASSLPGAGPGIYNACRLCWEGVCCACASIEVVWCLVCGQGYASFTSTWWLSIFDIDVLWLLLILKIIFLDTKNMKSTYSITGIDAKTSRSVFVVL